MMNVLICVREEKYAEYYKTVIREMCRDANIYRCYMLREAWPKALTTRMDLMFFDLPVREKGSEGTEWIRAMECLRRTPEYTLVPMIFITELEDIGFYAYNRLHAYACYQKPLNKRLFCRDIGELMSGISRKRAYDDFWDTVHFFRNKADWHVVRAEELVRVEKHSHFGYVVSVDHEFRADIRALRLDTELFCTGKLVQCSRSDYVNLRYIRSVEKGRILLKGKFGEVQLTAAGRTRVLQALGRR